MSLFDLPVGEKVLFHSTPDLITVPVEWEWKQ
jgi:hypothetical protein